MTPRPRIFAAILALALSACGAPVGEGRVTAATLNERFGALDVSLSLQLSRTQLAALDHGIPLFMEFVIEPENAPELVTPVQLSYLPMANRYQLLINGIPPRQFTSRLQLIAALDRTRLPLPTPMPPKGTVRLRLDTNGLPAPLRLSALFDREWRMSSQSLSWAEVK